MDDLIRTNDMTDGGGERGGAGAPNEVESIVYVFALEELDARTWVLAKSVCGDIVLPFGGVELATM